jgi:hypothetical protein
MNQQSPSRHAIDDFILREMDSVPHLEALLLLWNSRPRQWSAADMSAALYVDEDLGLDILQNLARRQLATRAEDGLYAYHSASPERDALLHQLELQYRSNLIRITRMIHAKASPGVREFADAFRFKKDRE